MQLHQVDKTYIRIHLASMKRHNSDVTAFSEQQPVTTSHYHRAARIILKTVG